MSVLQFATAEEGSELTDLQKAWQAARETAEEHRRARQKVDEDLSRLASRLGRNASAAAARYLGEAGAGEVALSTGPSRAELEEIGEGLKIRIRDDEEAEGRAKRELVGAIERCARAWLERAAAPYVAMARELARCHADLLAGAELLRVAGGEPDALNQSWFESLVVPAPALTAAKGCGRLVDSTFGTRVLAGGDRTWAKQAGEVAYGELAAALRQLLGGEIPLKDPVAAVTGGALEAARVLRGLGRVG